MKRNDRFIKYNGKSFKINFFSFLSVSAKIVRYNVIFSTFPIVFKYIQSFFSLNKYYTLKERIVNSLKTIYLVLIFFTNFFTVFLLFFFTILLYYFFFTIFLQLFYLLFFFIIFLCYFFACFLFYFSFLFFLYMGNMLS